MPLAELKARSDTFFEAPIRNFKHSKCTDVVSGRVVCVHPLNTMVHFIVLKQKLKWATLSLSTNSLRTSTMYGRCHTSFDNVFNILA
jgi:hypothetical protein